MVAPFPDRSVAKPGTDKRCTVLQAKQAAAEAVRERLLVDSPQQEPLAEGAGAGVGGDGGPSTLGSSSDHLHLAVLGRPASGHQRDDVGLTLAARQKEHDIRTCVGTTSASRHTSGLDVGMPI